jgi:hypothetical protein
MTRPFQIDPKRDRAWLRKALEQAGEAPRRKRQPKATLGLLGKRIALLRPEQRIEVERLVSRLLAEQEEE